MTDLEMRSSWVGWALNPMASTLRREGGWSQTRREGSCVRTEAEMGVRATSQGARELDEAGRAPGAFRGSQLCPHLDVSSPLQALRAPTSIVTAPRVLVL